MIIVITLIIAFAAISQFSIEPAFACHEGHTHHPIGDSPQGPCTYPEPEPLDPCNPDHFELSPDEYAACFPEPEPLSANAGEDQQVTELNQIIQLDSKGSTGQDLKYNWIMIEGPSSVVLDNPQSPNPTFVFPTSDEFDSFERKVTFQLEVTNELGTDTDTVEIKDSCFVEDKPFKTYNSGPWSFKYGIVEKEGLVLKDIRAGKELLFDSISVPHFRIVDSAGNDRIIRFCDSSSPGQYIFSPEIEPPVATSEGVSNLQWAFSVNFEEEYGDRKGELVIKYDIAIVSKEVDNCEPLTVECYRFVPKVSYEWHDPSSSDPLPPLEKFAAFYRLDYASNTGLARVKDADTFASMIIKNVGDQPMTTNEVGFLAVENGQPRDYDNTHTAHPNQGIFIPGCRPAAEFDCIHMHWKWPKSADPMVEPSTGEPLSGVSPGTANLVPGQTIAIAIVKNNPGEEDPDDVSALVNNEQIATARAAAAGKMTPGMPNVEFCENCSLVSGGDPIVWYVASVSEKNKDTFFRHGFFVLDTMPGDSSTTDGNLIQDTKKADEPVDLDTSSGDQEPDSGSATGGSATSGGSDSSLPGGVKITTGGVKLQFLFTLKDNNGQPCKFYHVIDHAGTEPLAPYSYRIESRNYSGLKYPAGDYTFDIQSQTPIENPSDLDTFFYRA